VNFLGKTINTIIIKPY